MLNNIVDNIEQCGQQNKFNDVFIKPEQVIQFFSVQSIVYQRQRMHKPGHISQ